MICILSNGHQLQYFYFQKLLVYQKHVRAKALGELNARVRHEHNKRQTTDPKQNITLSKGDLTVLTVIMT